MPMFREGRHVAAYKHPSRWETRLEVIHSPQPSALALAALENQQFQQALRIDAGEHSWDVSHCRQTHRVVRYTPTYNWPVPVLCPQFVRQILRTTIPRGGNSGRFYAASRRQLGT